MKYLIGGTVAFLTMIILNLLIHYVFKFTVDRFLIGWVCCMGYYIGKGLERKIDY